MRFLVDAQLPRGLARFLTDQGHGAVHVADAGLRDAEDMPILEYATENGMAIITKDEDFAARTAWQDTPLGIVWLRVGNCSNRALLSWFRPLLPDIVLRLESGERLIEIV